MTNEGVSHVCEKSAICLVVDIQSESKKPSLSLGESRGSKTI